MATYPVRGPGTWADSVAAAATATAALLFAGGVLDVVA